MAALLLTDAGARPGPRHVADRIETARLRLRMFEPADLDPLCDITSDPEVMRYIGHGHTLTREETRSNLDSIVAGFRRRGFGRWALESKATGRLAGYCGLSLVSDEVGVEIAYLLARAEWGRGLALEAGRACVRYAFERLGLRSLAGLTLRENRRSRRVLERLGMSLVGDAHFYGFDCAHYRLAREDWRADSSFYRVVG